MKAVGVDDDKEPLLYAVMRGAVSAPLVRGDEQNPQILVPVKRIKGAWDKLDIAMKDKGELGFL